MTTEAHYIAGLPEGHMTGQYNLRVFRIAKVAVGFESSLNRFRIVQNQSSGKKKMETRNLHLICITFLATFLGNPMNPSLFERGL